jgi:hypothetical protein
MMMWRWVGGFVCALALVAEAAGVDFAREVAPIFEAHCVRCHREGQAKGEVVIGGEGFEEHVGKLIELVTAKPGTRAKMPKSGAPLNEVQVAVLRRWVEEGARFPTGAMLKDRSRADGEWWSLRPIADVAVPELKDFPEGWDDEIDRFVLVKMREKGLWPNGEAGRRELIRRVTYDLTGLPPSPEEVDSFVGDQEVGAYERVVERLLASPRYGEKWGRHWLDVVRFGESNGFERNILIENVWPFRDYVIRAFNEDKPFDRLVMEHLAGDVVGEPVGTAFLVCGPYDNVGNSDAAAAAVIRADTVDEMIRATSEAFLGLTVGCARCHDHKFDPIATKDYYALYATLAGVTHGERELSGKKVWAGQFKSAPGACRVLLGGDPKKQGDEVTAGSPAVLPARYQLPASAADAERRVALAKWVVSPENPLTARVLANRLWHYHFGVGIVDTPGDFGFMGGKPTHPELLDWLAKRLVKEGWKLKAMHRLIVTSGAYRQASAHREEAAKIDGGARLLWRFPSRRLTGEEVRDTMLATAGKLQVEPMGGPGFKLYKYVQDNVATYYPLDEHGPETYRRAVYHTNARAARVDVLSDFDCPDPAAAVSRRAATTTPMQALALMNHTFTRDMAEAMAKRVERDVKDDRAGQVVRVFELAYARRPTWEELAKAVELAERRGMAALCLAVLNTNELVYLR